MTKGIAALQAYIIAACMAAPGCSKNVAAQTGTDNPALLPASHKTIKIKPSAADPSVHYWDSAHVVYYDPAVKNNKVLLWLTGTNGSTNNVPRDFFNTALEQGYRIISLSFISVPGISQVCILDTVARNPDCAAQFRKKRIYGGDAFPYIKDENQDAIVVRLVKLLQYLSQHDAVGHWDQYLASGKPVWKKIAVAGQSQGGGMAEFIGQHEQVARVISFSGGWDFSNSRTKTIAGWYRQPCITPDSGWYATYHIKENAADILRQTYEALPIPSRQIFALEQPLFKNKKGNNPYHGEGIQNPVYKPVWKLMLGSGL